MDLPIMLKQKFGTAYKTICRLALISKSTQVGGDQSGQGSGQRSGQRALGPAKV